MRLQDEAQLQEERRNEMEWRQRAAEKEIAETRGGCIPEIGAGKTAVFAAAPSAAVSAAILSPSASP